ncbi:aminoglycoside phosphotransferase family protein [Actinocatenispora sera]|jgi:streptomycin 6-kinase|uniref:aminoglycoside phosphotransferase family protein n=1 Tax=Actinocatenispora sera TaxID=390989 RepID=UPI0033FD70D0
MTELAQLAVPEDVRQQIHRRWPTAGPAWSAVVADELHELLAEHHATHPQVMPARYGLVISANTPTGPLVFRSTPDPDGVHQATVSRALAELDVSPHIHQVHASDTGVWTIMDRITPGIPLGDLTDPPTLDAIVGMLRPLAGQPAPDANLPSLFDWIRDRLTDDHLNDLPRGRTVAPLPERRQALALTNELARDHIPGLCHGDTSPWNILTGDRLYLIDPRGVSGELAYDAAIIAVKAARDRPIDQTIRTISAALGLDSHRVAAWTTVAAAARV